MPTLEEQRDEYQAILEDGQATRQERQKAADRMVRVVREMAVRDEAYEQKEDVREAGAYEVSSSKHTMDERRQYVEKLMEKDPNGTGQHEVGAKFDRNKPRVELVLGGFALALIEVAKVGTFGAQKYTDHGWKSVPRGFQRYQDAAGRHRLHRQAGDIFDKESKLIHLAHEAWNVLACLQLYIEGEYKVEDH